MQTRRNTKMVLYTSMVIFVMIVTVLIFRTKDHVNKTIVEINPAVIDLGIIQAGTEYDVPIKLKNVGEASLHIESVGASCNCMESKKTYLPIPPDDTATIHIKVTPDFSGFYLEKVFIFCNSEDSPLPVIIQANVENSVNSL